MKLVIKIGGSLCIDENGPIHSYFSMLVPILNGLKSKNQIIVSIGGGKFIRKYYKSVERLGLNNKKMEWIAVDLLKVNTRFLAYLLKLKPIFTLEEINGRSSGVISGIKPGRSTDANAAYASKKIKADLFIKLTNVDGIYDKDPKKYKNAKKLKAIKFSELSKYGVKGEPGSYGILDKTAIGIIKKNKIKTIIINGGNPKNLLKAIKGRGIGTSISD